MRRLTFALVAVAALAWAGSGSASARPSAKGPGSSSVVRGIVQSLSQNELVVRTLDGSTVRVAVDANTRIRVNDKPASILAIQPGFVVVLTQHGNAPLTVDAYGATLVPAGVRPVVGTLRLSTAASVLLSVPGHGGDRFALDPASRIFVDGKVGSTGRLVAGDVVVVRPAAGESKTAYEVDAFSHPGAYGGTIASVTSTTLAVRTRPGRLLRFRMASFERLYLNGASASAARLRVGLVVVVRGTPRRELWAFASA
jgi:hypothetical protein